MERNEITLTHLQWIIHALQKDMALTQDEMNSAPDDSPIVAIGKVLIEGRQNLVTRLNDIVESGYKTIRIRK